MCGTMCCQVPPYATIKAFDNTTPFAFNWRDDKATPNDGAEWSIRQSSIFSETQSTGCRNPNSGATAGDDGCLLNRNTSTGADARDNSSGLFGNRVSHIPIGNGVAETWAIGFGQASGGYPYGYRYSNAGSPGAPYSLSATTASPVTQMLSTSAWNNVSPLGASIVDSTSLIVGSDNTDSVVARKFNSSGVLTNQMLKTSLSSVSGSVYALSLVTTGANALVVGGAKRLWLLSTSLAEAAAATVISGTLGGFSFLVDASPANLGGNWLFNMSTPSGGHVILPAYSLAGSLGSATSMNVRLYKVVTSGMGLLGATIFKELRVSKVAASIQTPNFRVLGVDASNVYVYGSFTSTIGGVSTGHNVVAINHSTGAIVWTATGMIPARARVLTSGLAIWMNQGGTDGFTGMRLLSISTGSTLTTLDNATIYDVAEFSSQFFCVGPKRESHE